METGLYKGKKGPGGPLGKLVHMPAVDVGGLAKASVSLRECLLFASHLILVYLI